MMLNTNHSNLAKKRKSGFKTISQTLDTYSHLLDEHKKEQGQRVRELFS